jgi:nucleoside-diphosphate-sugar epimerase
MAAKALVHWLVMRPIVPAEVAPGRGGGRPSPLRRSTLLLIGCGDVGLRVARLLRGRWRLLALTSSPSRCSVLRAAGITPLLGNLDDRRSLGRLAALPDAVLHLAPPPSTGERDQRTANLLRTLALGARSKRLVYISTSGVYGDCAGERIDETRVLHPATDRARRRVDAEQRVRAFGAGSGVSVSVLRVPGIYALDRAGGDPRERLRQRSPVLVDADDVYTNHVHADDLAQACVAALYRGAPQRAYHVCDDSDLKMGQYFDLAATLFELPLPPRISRLDAAAVTSPLRLSFMSESRRMSNQRLKRELRLQLRYPTVREGLQTLPQRRREVPNGDWPRQ